MDMHARKQYPAEVGKEYEFAGDMKTQLVSEPGRRRVGVGCTNFLQPPARERAGKPLSTSVGYLPTGYLLKISTAALSIFCVSDPGWRLRVSFASAAQADFLVRGSIRLTTIVPFRL